MNRLSSLSLKILLLLFVFIGINFTASAQKKVKKKKYYDFEWKKPKAETVKIPAEFADRDAVILEKEEVLTLRYKDYRLSTHGKTYKRIKILTNNGIEKFAKIVLPKYSGVDYGVVDARTIKSNGNVVDLKAKLIKEVDVQNDDAFFDKDNYLLFAIPGVEVGDIIEIIYYYRTDGIIQSDLVYMHDYLPVVNAKYIFKKADPLAVDIRMYNDMPQPTSEKVEGSSDFTWTLNNLDGYFGQTGAVPAMQLPYISLIVRKAQFGSKISTIELLTNWNDYAKEHANDYLASDNKSIAAGFGKLEKFIKELVKDIDEKNKKEQVEKIVDYINNNVVVQSKATGKSIYDKINERRIDNKSLSQFYDFVFKTLDIEHYMVLGKYFDNGYIDPDFPSFVQINKILFSFEDENGKAHYLTPKTNNNIYYVDEVPISLDNTSGVKIALNPELKYQTGFVNFSKGNYKQNLRSVNVESEINLTDQNITQSVVETLTGRYSILYRKRFINDPKLLNKDVKESFEKRLKKRNENAELNEITVSDLEQKHPFAFDVNYSFTESNVINKVEDNVFSINIKDWFWTYLPDVQVENRSMDYFEGFPSTDKYVYTLKFKEKVKLLNVESLTKSLNYEYGSFDVTAKQSNDNSITLTVKYTIKNKKWPFEKIEEMVKMITTFENFESEEILFEVK